MASVPENNLASIAQSLAPLDLTAEAFEEVRTLAYRVFGLNLHEGKEGLVRSRLAKRLRALRLPDFAAYLEHVREDESELTQLVDVLTTNKTSFFREAQHLTYLSERVLPDLLPARRPIRIWSAGCSTGEEPVSIAMQVLESVPDADRLDIRILATDISTRVLALARNAVYDEESLRALPPGLAQTYFEPVRGHLPRVWRPKERVRRLIRLARLNLMEPWPMRGRFDVIFCRNVMIYFDRPTQERLVGRFWSILNPGGHLFVGHSESMTALRHQFTYLAPAVYRRSPDGSSS